MQSLLDAGSPAGNFNYWKSNFLRALSDEAIETMILHFGRVPSPNSGLLIEQIGGAVARVNDDATAFNQRSSPFNFLALGTWTDPTQTPQNVAWTRDAFDAMQPFTSGGVYLNYLGDEGQDRVRAAYGAPKYERLVALKNKYDPTNLFHLNQNIQPATA